MAKVFERGLTTPTGYVLPVQRWNAIAAQTRWVTEKWKTRRGKLFLAARRLSRRLPPAAVVAEAHPADVYPHVVPMDPLAPRGALPEPDALLADKAAAPAAGRHVHRRPDDPAGAHRAGNLRDRGRGPHRDHRRSPRRPALASSCRRSRRSRTGSSWSPPPRPRRRRSACRCSRRGLCAAARSAAQRHPRRARSRRHRGQHPPRRRAGTTASRPPPRSTRRPASRGSAPTSS